MADAGIGRHDAEIVEGFLAPAQETIALAVAVELHLDVLFERVGGAEIVDHDRVVDDQVDRHQRVHLLGLAAQMHDAVAHRGEVDHAGDAGEILHEDAGGRERHFLGGGGLFQPAGDGLGIVHLVAAAVFEAQHVFQEDFQGFRQFGDVAQGLGGFLEGVIFVLLPINGQGFQRFQTILANGCHVGTLSYGRLVICLGLNHSQKAPSIQP